MRLFSSLRQLLASVCVVAAAMAAPAAHAGTYAQTKYPIVLVHGFLGFNSVLGINYFYGVPSSLRNNGAKVYIAQVNPAQSNEYRGEQLIQQLKQWAARDGVTKFNLIAHSQGGPTARYAAAVAPGLVASVGTVSATHFGSKTADYWNAHIGSTWTNSVANGIATVLNVIYGGSGSSVSATDVSAALSSLSTAGATTFNAKYPQGAPTSYCGQGPAKANGIAYYSAGGGSVLTNVFDISDALLGLTSLPFGGTANDGLVSTCSSHWGTVLKDNYAWNHLDEINHLLGLRGLFTPDPVSFYNSLANRLKNQGL
ncbi:MAG: triacylglycerol lipase [Burkholderiales bacterium]|nr:triacylglycerol lipase [Burkholderiales bacterium]MDE2075460.1 triacylglycerol lipase [Burkholderiales bacterium]MDE2431226.1 triacylglycerol lipase [Burkholderiales bacterium]